MLVPIGDLGAALKCFHDEVKFKAGSDELMKNDLRNTNEKPSEGCMLFPRLTDSIVF